MEMQSGFTIIIDLVISVIMAGTAVWMFALLSGYGGHLGKSFRVIAWGGALMAVSHLIEIGAHSFGHSSYFVMFAHRFIAAISFILITYGFKMFIKKN